MGFLKKALRGVAIATYIAVITSVYVWVGDSMTGYGYSREATVVEVPAKVAGTHRLIVHLPGYTGNEWATRSLGEHLDTHGNVVGFPYPKGKFVPDSHFERMRKTLNGYRATTEVWMLAQSMGAKVFRDFVAWVQKHDKPLFNWLLGANLKLVLESAPACAEDVKKPLWQLRLAKTLDGLNLSGGQLATKMLVRPNQKRELHGYPTPIDANPIFVDRGHKDFTDFTMPAMLSQGGFLSGYALPDSGEARLLNQLVDKVIFVSGEGPDDDPAIKIRQAIGHWMIIFPLMDVFTVSNWKPTMHSPNAERPKEYADILVRALA